MFCYWYRGDKCHFTETGLVFFPECADDTCIGADDCRHYAVTEADVQKVIAEEQARLSE